MPLARIDLSERATPELVRAVSDAVYDAMAAVAGVPPNDKFQIVTRHAPGELIYPKDGYLGNEYSPDIILIQVTWVAGRSTEVKKKFYDLVATTIHQKQGVRKEDVSLGVPSCRIVRHERGPRPR